MKFNTFLSALTLLLICNTAMSQSNGVVINELMSANTSAVADEAGDFDDWIELFNNTNAAIDVSGYGLSDEVDDLGKYKIPDNTILGANAYLIIWADDDQEQGPLHAQFKLSATGESLFLTDRSNEIVDEVTFDEVPENRTYARDPNGTGSFRIKQPSFSGNNDLVSSTINPLPISVKVGPNPSSDFIQIEMALENQDTAIKLYDLSGRLMYSSFLLAPTTRIDVSGFAAGNYFLNIGPYQGVLVQKID